MVSSFRLVLASTIVLALAGCREPERALVLATTTSVQDSGLLDALLPGFSEGTGIRVQVVAVGTGAALRMGREGNADALLTHAPTAEQELVRQGALSARLPLWENHFVIAGPADDPALVAGAATAAEGMRRIRESSAPFVSRGDDSGTHRRERALWRAADLDPDGSWEGHASTGSGMGLTLQVAGERRAYVLSDIATFLAFRDRTGLVPLSGADPALRNVYSFLRVSPERFPDRVRSDLAEALETYLTRRDVFERVASFGIDRFGQSLFRPVAAGSGRADLDRP